MKLTDHIQKIVEIIVEELIWQQVYIHEMQFTFMSGCGTTDAILILRQWQKQLEARVLPALQGNNKGRKINTHTPIQDKVFKNEPS